MQGARHGTRSQVSSIRPWAEGSAKPLSHLGCPDTDLFLSITTLLLLTEIKPALILQCILIESLVPKPCAKTTTTTTTKNQKRLVPFYLGSLSVCQLFSCHLCKRFRPLYSPMVEIKLALESSISFSNIFQEAIP